MGRLLGTASYILAEIMSRGASAHYCIKTPVHDGEETFAL